MTEHHVQVTIRPATAMDSCNIARLMKASWDPSHAAGAVRVHDQRAVRYVVDLLNDSRVIVADLSGRLVGALACALMRERWSQPEDWFLVDEFLMVPSTWVTRGIIERLLTDMETYADMQQLPLLLGGALISPPEVIPLPPMGRLGCIA